MKIPPYTVFLDTNALHTPNETLIINPDLEKKIRDCRGITEVRVFIPSLALKEIIFQKFQSIATIHSKAVRQINAVGALLSTPKNRLISDTILRRRIQRAVLSYCRDNEIIPLRTPINKIDWRRIIAESVWRLPPFSPTTPESKAEKGFRDAMLVETIVAFCLSAPKENYILVSGDRLLGETIKKRLSGKIDSFSLHQNIDQLESFLKLKRDEKINKFAGLIFESAPKYFYSEDSTECVAAKFNVIINIREKFSFFLEFPPAPEPTPLLGIFPTLPANTNPMVQVSDDKFWVQGTVFDKINQKGRHAWATTVACVKLYTQKNNLLDYLPAPEFVRVAKATVKWSAIVDEDGKFSDLLVDDYIWGGQTTEPATFDSYTKWGLPSPTDRLIAQLSNPQSSSQPHS